MNINWDYVAGFTDGEGYLGVIGKGPRIQWGQKDKRQLEVIKDFLESENLHPYMLYRKPGPKRPNFIHILSLTRRKEVAYVIKQLESRVVLKLPACNLIKNWLLSHPAYANMSPVDYDTFSDLHSQGYTQGEIAKRMNYGRGTIWKFAKENGFKFEMGIGGGIVDGKRLPPMTKEEYRLHKINKEKVGICPKCGSLMWKASKQCRACSNKNRTKRTRTFLATTTCGTCGNPIQKSASQLRYYPLSFCNKYCKSKYWASHWAKDYDRCTDCGTTEIDHMAKGKCKKCHNKWYSQAHPRKKKSLSKT